MRFVLGQKIINFTRGKTTFKDLYLHAYFLVLYLKDKCKKRNFDEIVSLGYNCEVGQRINNIFPNGFNHYLYTYSYELDRKLFLKSLDELCHIYKSNFTLIKENGMFLADEYQIRFHSRNKNAINYFSECINRLNRIREQIPETLPFSNLWCAKETASRLPENSCVHLGILNSLRCWNFFDFPQGVEGYSNTGGFGIDGGLSSCVGACLANPERIHFMVIGDLAFFYDMNVLGNRHVLKNLRVLLINNGRGTEFTNFDHLGAVFGADADSFIAAAGHYGKQSRQLIKHYAEDLGFEYLTAATKEEYLSHLPRHWA